MHYTEFLILSSMNKYRTMTKLKHDNIRDYYENIMKEKQWMKDVELRVEHDLFYLLIWILTSIY